MRKLDRSKVFAFRLDETNAARLDEYIEKQDFISNDILCDIVIRFLDNVEDDSFSNAGMFQLDLQEFDAS